MNNLKQQILTLFQEYYDKIGCSPLLGMSKELEYKSMLANMDILLLKIYKITKQYSEYKEDTTNE